MPKTVLNVNITQTQGKYSFDPVSKLLVWEVGRMEAGKLPNVKGIINLQSGAPLPDSNHTILVKLTISQLSISGLKVNRLDMYGEVNQF
jgi:AP-3 complex subunit mu